MLNRNTIHIILSLLCMAVCPCGLLTSCIYDDGLAPEEEPGTEGTYAMLTLNAGIADVMSRAGEDVPSVELIHSLRILVFHSNGTVEHNRYVEFVGEKYAAVLPVTKGETKKICLVANETSIPGLTDKLEGALLYTGIKDIVLDAPDYSKPLPMSCCYDITVGDEARIERDLYLVRTAVKFDIRFVNTRSHPVCVTSCAFNSVASSAYLMPHLDDGCGRYILKGDGITGEKQTFSIDGKEVFWIDWLKYAVGRSQTYPDDITLADRDGWILEYSIPAGGQSVARDLLAEFNGGQKISLATTNGEASIPTFYLPESKKLMTASAFAPGLEQEYTLDITLNENGKAKTFEAVKLPNLRGLFRNTHVKVTITISELTVDLVVEVAPYTVVGTLSPVFGIGRDENGNIYARDSYGNKLKKAGELKVVFTSGGTTLYTLDSESGGRVNLVDEDKTISMPYLLENNERKLSEEGKYIYCYKEENKTNYCILGTKGAIIPTDKDGVKLPTGTDNE